MAGKGTGKGGNMAVVLSEFNQEDPTMGLQIVERDIPRPKAGAATSASAYMASTSSLPCCRCFRDLSSRKPLSVLALFLYNMWKLMMS